MRTAKVTVMTKLAAHRCTICDSTLIESRTSASSVSNDETGGDSPGQAFISLPEEVRRAVREEVRRDLGDIGGAIGVEVEIRFGSGRR